MLRVALPERIATCRSERLDERHMYVQVCILALNRNESLFELSFVSRRKASCWETKNSEGGGTRSFLELVCYFLIANMNELHLINSNRRLFYSASPRPSRYRKLAYVRTAPH